MRAILFTVLCSLLFTPLNTPAQDNKNNTKIYVPQVLESWTRWIKERHPEWSCASYRGSRECVWPGMVSLQSNIRGSRFVIDIEVLAKQTLPLPGSGDLLPHNIAVTSSDGASALYHVFTSGNFVYIELEAGRYRIEGEFKWQQVPREIALPASYGLLRFSGDEGLKFHREGGMLLFDEIQETLPESGLFVVVMRRFLDGSPLIVDTQLQLRVAGGTRSVQFGDVLPEGSVPISVSSELSHQLSKEGKLSLQLRPGIHTVLLRSVMEQPVPTLRAPRADSPAWPKEEVWSWSADNLFRSVEVQNAEPISADLTQLPDEWRSGATYLVPSGAEVALKELRRGEERPASNALALEREYWLDLDGRGFTVVDKFSGLMNQRFRVSALPETALGRADIAGKPVLITRIPGTPLPGVELRDQTVNLSAVSRVARQEAHSSVGWEQSMQSVSSKLNLAPAWRLLHLSGASSVSGSWVDSWTLLDVFVLLLLTVGCAKLLGRSIAVLGAISLILSHAEFLEPRMLFIHMLIGFAFREMLSDSAHWFSALCKLFLKCTFVVWSIEVLTFSKLQFTQLLFPQLESGTRYRTVLQSGIALLESNFLVWPVVFLGCALVLVLLRYVIAAPSAVKAVLRLAGAAVLCFAALIGIGIAVTFLSYTFGSRYKVNQSYSAPSTHLEENYQYRRAPEELKSKDFFSSSAQVMSSDIGIQAEMATEEKTSKSVQSGPAIPAWRWRTHYVSFAGPVDPAHMLTFYLMPPFFTRLCSLLRVCSLILLVVLLMQRLGYSISLTKFKGAAVGTVLFLLIAPRFAAAEYPSQALLKELEDRMAQDLCTRDICSNIESLAITLQKHSVTLKLKSSSDGLSAVAIPGPLEQLWVDDVSVNGATTSALRRDDQGFLWVKVPDGHAVIEAHAKISPDAVTTLQFAQRPNLTSVDSSEWEVEGLLPTGAVKSALRLIPKSRGGSAPKLTEVILPSWFSASRRIIISDQNRVVTTVERLGEMERPASVRIPLLNGEKVTTGTVSVEDEAILVRFPAGESYLSFESSLPSFTTLTLSARKTPWLSEEWRVYCGEIFRCEFSGLKANQTVAEGKQLAVWKPFPGDEVQLTLTQLEGIDGDSITLDTVSHRVKWGSSLLEGEVRTRVRATRQRALTITMPSGASLKRTLVDEQEGRVVESSGKAQFLLNPGEHVLTLEYEQAWRPAILAHVPVVELSAPANNLAIRVSPSPERWILWVGGLPWGPAVLFWAKLFFVILFCIVLAKGGILPLSLTQVFFLSLGLATLPMIILVVPLSWLACMKLYPRYAAKVSRVNSALRVSAFVALTLISIALLYEAVRRGLIIQPPMLVVGNNSTIYSLNWFSDHATNPLPQPWIVSLPLWYWRITMLVWSTWLSFAMLSWLKLAVLTTKELAHD